MTRNFLVISLLISLALSSYLPMSMKNINFGDHICRYYDKDEQIDYVRPCEANKYCQETETSLTSATAQNKLHTCQNYVVIPPNPTTPLKDRFANCQRNDECGYGLYCISNKCDLSCTNTGEQVYKIDNHYECRYVDNKCIYIKDGSTIDYNPRNCKVCGKIHFKPKNDGDGKEYQVLDSVDENDLYYNDDGEFVLDSEACKSKTALYFYGDNKIKNEIDLAHQSENIMYLRCVTIKAVDHDRKRFNYTIGSGDVFIYDINEEIVYDDQDKKTDMQNLCNKFLMTQIQLWNDNKEEYINYLKCPETNQADDNLKRKVYYLENPENYLLYKDRTEVIEYLIQKRFPEIVPIITPKDSAGVLKFKYLILSLILLLL